MEYIRVTKENLEEDHFKPNCLRKIERNLFLLLLSETQDKTDISIPGQFVIILLLFLPNIMSIRADIFCLFCSIRHPSVLRTVPDTYVNSQQIFVE